MIPRHERAMSLEIRSLRSESDYEACMAAQMVIWGDDIREVVPPRIQKISQEVGGVAAGGFDAEGRLLGFVWGLTGVRHGRLGHWSHMLGILPEARNSGLGRALKLFQRDSLLEIGVPWAYWTFDPLESRNAHLNFNRLGVEVEKYVRDYYGAGATSHLHQGLGTDRFVVAWPLACERTDKALANALPENTDRYEEAPIANTRLESDGRVCPFEGEPPEAPMVRIEIPVRIQEVKAAESTAGQSWRLSTRRAFESLMARGQRIHAFYHSAASGRSFYVAW